MSTSSKSASRHPAVRHTITFELVQPTRPTPASPKICPARSDSEGRLITPPFSNARKNTSRYQLQTLQDALNEKALRIHLQRVVSGFVGSAYGAAQFYGTKVTQARDLTVASQNDDRDEDRGGTVGFESKAQRARIFAAEMGLQAYALTAAAEGAIFAYAHITGEEWKPYEARGPRPPPASVASRRPPRWPPSGEAPRGGGRAVPAAFLIFNPKAPGSIFIAPRRTRIGRGYLHSVAGVSPPFRLAVPREGCRSRRVRR